MADVALLVIDMQRGLFTKPAYELDAVIDRINQLATSARQAGAPVIFIQHEKAGSPLAFETEAWRLVEALVTEPDDRVVRKQTPDAFQHTALHQLLTEQGVTELVICGYASEFCVDTTTRRAAALGYPVTLVADAHTTHDKPHASAAQIRAHENATLPNITSFGPRIRALPTELITFR